LVHGFSYITFIFHETPFSYTFQAFCPVLREEGAKLEKLTKKEQEQLVTIGKVYEQQLEMYKKKT
jgi:hypothetical protein